jgi:hypothetical protein
MKFRLPRGQSLIPLVVLGLVVALASFGAALPPLDPSSAGLSTLPPCTTLGDLDGTSGSAADQALDGDGLTSSTAVGLPGDDSTTSTDPDDTTTSTSDPDDTTSTSDPDDTTTSTSDPGDTTTSTSDPGDTTTTTTSDPDDTTTTTDEPGDTTTSTSDPDDTTTSNPDEPGDTTTTSDPDDTTTTGCSPGTTSGGGGGKAPTVAILDRLKNPTTKLRVGKWEQAFTATGALKANFVDLDTDHFHVRVVDNDANNPKALDTVQAMLKTDSPGTDYDDGPVTLDLVETGVNTCRFGSKPLLLVSNQPDDKQPTDGNVKDNQPNDRSFLVALGAKVTASYGMASASADVPARAVVKLHLTVLTKPDGTPLVGEPFLDKPVNDQYDGDWNKGEDWRDIDGNGVWTQFLAEEKLKQRIEDDLRHANEAFAQVGIRLVPTDAKNLVAYQVANGALSSGKLAVGKGSLGIRKLTPEEKALHDNKAWYSNDPNDVEVFYVSHIPGRNLKGDIMPGIAFSGWAFAESAYATYATTNKQFTNSFLAANHSPLAVLAHETYHIVAQSPGHIGNEMDTFKPNLMSYGPQHLPVRAEQLKVTNSRRLTTDQSTKIIARYLQKS